MDVENITCSPLLEEDISELVMQVKDA